MLTCNSDLFTQTLNISKNVSNVSPNAGNPFSYIINASCNSSTNDCETVVFTDNLPSELEFLNFSNPLPDAIGSATYNPITHSVTVTFDATGCSSCTPDGVNTDNDDFAQGSTIQFEIQVRFPNGTFNGTTADNTISATSANAGNPSANAPQVTSTNGNTPQSDCDQMVYYTSSGYRVLLGGESYVRVRVANDGLSDINNWTSTITFPSNWNYDVLYTPHIPSVNHTGSIYYERSDQIGFWHFLSNFNTNLEERIPESDLGLPAGIDITKMRLDMGTLSGDGFWNQNTFNDDWSASFRMYGTNFGLTDGSTLNFCATTSGVVNSINCSNTDCDETTIIAGEPIIEGGKEILDLSGNVVNTFSPGDQYKVSLHFASDPLNNTDVIGGVLVDLLPPGMTYVPGSWEYGWDSDNIQNQNPVVQTGYDVSGQQWVRFVYDASLGNEFTITPDGTWEGFGIEFTVQIGPGVVQGIYENHYYFTSTGSDHGCTGTDYSGGSTYLGGYAYDDNYCFDSEPVEIIWAPGSAGLDSNKKVKGTLNSNYNNYPDYGTTVPGGINDYAIVLTNPNSTPINNITIIDIFPYVGDSEILNTSAPRFSEWKPNLLAPIAVPIGTTIFYTTVSNPCRDELASPTDSTPFPSGCNSANWSTTPPSDITSVTGIKLDLGSTTINQGETFELEWEMRAPVNAPTNGEISWNSFAYIADNASNGTSLLPAEPIKVGIESIPGTFPFLGDFVWNDMDGNGIQDMDEPGLDGITVILKEDSNGNGLPDPADLEVSRTVTANGGLYLFSQFPFGDYHIEFSNLPTGYIPTNENIGSNDEIDSDGIISDVFSCGPSTNNRSIDLGLFFGNSLPSSCPAPITGESWYYGCDDDRSVEIIGVGIKNNLPYTINIPNPSDVIEIVAEVTYRNLNNGLGCVDFTTNIESLSSGPLSLENEGCNHGLVFRRTLQAANYVTASASTDNFAESFVLYITRQNSSNLNNISEGRFSSICLYRQTYCETYTILEQSLPRDIDIRVPLSEITNDARTATVSASACGVNDTETISTYNQGNSLAIVDLNLPNVPANCTSVEVCIESPTSQGQSLHASGAINFNSTCSPGIYWAEAECAILGANWNYVSDPTASNGKYATVNPGLNSSGSAPTGVEDRVQFIVEVPRDGNYNVFARVIAPSYSDDSFWVRANGGTWYNWNNLFNFAPTTWEWGQVSDSNNGGAEIDFPLLAGSNTIDFAYREDGVRLDKVMVGINQAVPTGEGDSADNCVEICTNGIDDDADGLVDGQDPDCINCAFIGENLIINGEFNDGNSGFTSDYIYRTPENTCGNYGWYSIMEHVNQIAAPSNPYCDEGIWSVADRNGSGGSFMVIDPSAYTGANDDIWSQSVPVCPQTDYVFSIWTKNIYYLEAPNYSGIDPNFNFSINNTVLPNANFTMPRQPRADSLEWILVQDVWNSGTNTIANLKILNLVPGDQGNDLAIDGLFFGLCGKTVEISSNANNICPGSTATITASTETVSSGWQFYELIENNTVIASGTSPTFTVNQAGTYILRAYTTSNNSGCPQESNAVVITSAGCCDTDSGSIGSDQSVCGTCIDPDEISSLSSPSGGSGPLEYVWMQSTTTCVAPASIADPNWTVITGANSETFDPEEIDCNTCYVRLSRRQGCPDYLITNIVSITIERKIFTNRFIRYNR